MAPLVALKSLSSLPRIGKYMTLITYWLSCNLTSCFDNHNEEADARKNVVVADGHADVSASAAMNVDNDDYCFWQAIDSVCTTVLTVTLSKNKNRASCSFFVVPSTTNLK